MRGQPLAVAGPLNQYSGNWCWPTDPEYSCPGYAHQRSITTFYSSVACDNEAGLPVPNDNMLAEVSRILSTESLQTKVVPASIIVAETNKAGGFNVGSVGNNNFKRAGKSYNKDYSTRRSSLD